MMDKLAEIIARPHFAAISLDVFDTVLYRNTKPEILRFSEIACKQAEALNSKGVNVRPVELFFARLTCTPIAYRTAHMNRFQREARFRDICRLILRSLDLDEDLANVLERVELEYELRNLYRNRGLVGLFTSEALNGRRLFFLSDMYLSEENIRLLLGKLVPELAFSRGYVSSTNSLTKAGGGLFDYLREQELLRPHQVLHIGDNYRSDFICARDKGFKAFHLPRHPLFYFMRDLREKKARFILKKKGFLL